MKMPIFFALFASPLAAAVCNCGFSLQDPMNNTEPAWLFTDMLESDFVKIQNISQDTQWFREEFNVSAAAGRGVYGKQFSPSNILEQQPSDGENVDSQQDAGLQLIVGSQLENGAVPSAELDTARLDLLWGSYRAGMKLTDVAGTCAAFFWYFNDTQEIDMEFLSSEFDRVNNVFPVNLVLQSKQSLQNGYDASDTGTYQKFNLTFDPTMAFHEYRFDFVPGRVLFYADSEVIGVMNGSAVPIHAGHVILQHWSNGNQLWSGGPPTTNAYLTVSYVKAYFNASEPQSESDFASRCDRTTGDRTPCVIPNVTAGNASTGGQFFSLQGNNNDTEQGGNGSSPSGNESRAVRMYPMSFNTCELLMIISVAAVASNAICLV